ncbi:MAG TPA: hypothetical protein PLQ00_10655, partial [Thermoguttaceae bacterium]|nr:hypothetical protein [Thermoguttaceae bacterium]
MPTREVIQLELLAEIDVLVENLRAWAESAPAWEPARSVQALIRRLLERLEGIRIRIDAPLVVATLGGTGTGKSALLNAVLGQEVFQTGVLRPTTCKPILVCRPDIRPEMLGIEPSTVEVCHRELPILAHLVLIDCPDPDTSESDEEAASNLARLRQILPHCDVLLVTGTQQKYRSGRVAEELARAATGARLIFVQTHADTDDDIRQDWQKVLASEYEVGRIFRIDCLRALEDARTGRPHQPEMVELLDLLTRQLSGAAAHRIRRANLLDLAAQALTRCAEKLQERTAAVEEFRQALQKEKQHLLEQLLPPLEQQVKSARRYWENRLVGEIAARWGSSPWAWVLRLYQSLGMVVLGVLGRRLPGPTPWLVWGGAIGWQFWRKRRDERSAQQRLQTLRTFGWQPAQVEEAAVKLQGYAWQAGLEAPPARPEHLLPETQHSAEVLLAQLSGQFEEVLRRQAARHSRWYVRGFYEFLLGGMIGGILYRLAKNYFWDSWLDPTPDASLYGLEFYVASLFWLLVWAALLIWAFLGRVRKGLAQQIQDCLNQWKHQAEQSPIFSSWEEECRKIRRFQEDLGRLAERVEKMRLELALPEDRLG